MMLLFSGRVPLHALAQDGVLLKDLGVALGAALLLRIVSSIVGLPLENTSQPKAFTRQGARKTGWTAAQQPCRFSRT